MKFPTPEDPGRAPVWENYIVAQVAQASLGLIPRHALAVGVTVDGTHLLLQFLLSEATNEDKADMDDIVDQLEGLIGQDIDVETSHEVLIRPDISPRDGTRWVFLSRVSE